MMAEIRVTEEGTLVNSRWLNEDGTRKDGLELEKEKLRVELTDIARRLLAVSKSL